MSIPPALSSPAAALLEVIERRTGCRGLAYALPPAPLTGGFWADIYAFRLAEPPEGFEGELVLRLMPDEERALREAVIQDAVAEQGFPTPRVRLHGDRAAGMGRPFIIMDRAAGGSLAGGLPPSERLQAFRRMPRLLAETMAALHALSPEPVAERLVAAGWPREMLGVEGLLAELRVAAARLALDGFDRALEWLGRTAPNPERLAVCHGDIQPYNLIVARGHVTALIDWTNARLADPIFDVAFTAQLLEQMPVELPGFLRPLLDRLGRRASRQFLEAYRRFSPVEAGHLPWYRALQSLRLLARVADERAPTSRRLHPFELVSELNIERFRALTGISLALPRDRGGRPVLSRTSGWP